MAQRVIVTLEDDLGGGPADETVHFAFGGAEYEIDLTAKNARAFRKKLAPFIEHARRAGEASPGGRAALPRAGRSSGHGLSRRVPRLSMRMRFTVISSPLAARARSSGLPVVNADR